MWGEVRVCSCERVRGRAHERPKPTMPPRRAPFLLSEGETSPRPPCDPPETRLRTALHHAPRRARGRLGRCARGHADALAALGEAGLLPAGEVKLLTETLQLELGVLQMIRCAHGSGFDPAQASSGFAARLAELGGCRKIEALEAALDTRMAEVRKVFERRIGKM